MDQKNTAPIPTGYRKLDALIGGGLRPGMGKTSFLHELYENADLLDFADGAPGCVGKSRIDNEGAAMELILRKIRVRPVCPTLFCADLNADKRTGLSKWHKLLSVLKEHGCAAVVSVSLPRRLKNRENRRPILADFSGGLFGHGGAARYADNVISLYRESYYDPLSDMNSADDAPNAEVIVLKSAGSTGTVQMRFDGKAQSWRETEK